jgi:hypothetical protein
MTELSEHIADFNPKLINVDELANDKMEEPIHPVGINSIPEQLEEIEENVAIDI